MKKTTYKKVFFIDDEADILDAVQVILESQGFTVKTATDLSSIDEIISFAPDIILLDILLRGKNSDDISRKLKKNKSTQNTPIIILSAHPNYRLKALAKEYDAAAYMQKPFDMDVLIALVKKHAPLS